MYGSHMQYNPKSRLSAILDEVNILEVKQSAE